MKTVTIPTCANPFVVIINGKKYTYPAGETVEVPDEVAEVIERHEEAKPQPEDAPEESGGVKSWNDLEDKPFYDESVTIEWDGNIEGKVTVADGLFVKVSDLTPEPSELMGGILTEGGSSATITADSITDCRADGFALVYTGEAFAVIYEDNCNVEGVDFAEKGVYAYAEIGACSLTYEAVKKLDPKFLPEGVGGGLPTIEFTTVITEGATLTETEISALGAVKEAGTLFVAKMTIALGEQLVPVQSTVDALTGLDIMEVGFTGLQYVALIMGGAIGVLFSNIDDGWVVNMLA